MAVRTLEDLRGVLSKEWSKLDEVKQYLSESGKGRLEALAAVDYHSRFCDSLEELLSYEGYTSLESIPGKDPEYYKTLKAIDFMLSRGNRGD